MSSSQHIYRLMDEPFNGHESPSRKRMRVELRKVVATDIGEKRADASEVASLPGSGTCTIFMADAILAGRSPRAEGIYQLGGSIRSAEGGASSAVGGGRVERAEDDGS